MNGVPGHCPIRRSRRQLEILRKILFWTMFFARDLRRLQLRTYYGRNFVELRRFIYYGARGHHPLSIHCRRDHD
jgi:hypothetical protein